MVHGTNIHSVLHVHEFGPRMVGHRRSITRALRRRCVRRKHFTMSPCGDDCSFSPNTHKLAVHVVQPHGPGHNAIIDQEIRDHRVLENGNLFSENLKFEGLNHGQSALSKPGGYGSRLRVPGSQIRSYTTFVVSFPIQAKSLEFNQSVCQFINHDLA